MNSNDSARGDEPEASILPGPVVAHELVFGRECTSGYLLEREARHEAPVDACADRVDASSTQPPSLEQRKPLGSIRV
jgi:hypothetical protein